MRFVALLLMLALALAGCSDGSDGSESQDPEPTQTPEPTQDPEPTSTPQSTGGEPTNGPSEENQAPAGTLVANIQQGEVPVDVTFTLEGTDPDGDDLSWTFQAGDGTESEGTTLPATVAHSYTEVGTYVATLTITDGELSASYNVTIDAAEAAIAPPDFETIIIAGTISGLYVGAPLVGGEYLTEPNVHDFNVPGVATAIDFLLEWDDMALDLDFSIITPNGETAASATSFNDPVLGTINDSAGSSESAQATDAAHLSQIGTWTANVYAASAYESAYTLTITFTA